jgi:glycerol-3-phosphate acyltransferase PlsX
MHASHDLPKLWELQRSRDFEHSAASVKLRIGIDLMGGDNPPELLMPAIIRAVEQLPHDHLFLVIATGPVIQQLTALLASSLSKQARSRVSFHECADVITMTDDPLTAVRHKKNSSLVQGIHLLKKKNIDAFVSCGNTGALIASAAISLSRLDGISQPALLATLPTERGPVAVLDAGGNLLNKAQHLVKLAFLGAAYQRALQGVETPTLGLLNVGVESRKGTNEVRQAYEILKSYCEDTAARGKEPAFRFSGNIEGRDVFKGVVDVLVTDGFTGNVLLKTAEGVAAFIFDSLQEKKMDGATPDFQSAFNDLKKQFNYAEYPGAIVCGVEGVVIKVHGNATAESLLASILGACRFPSTSLENIQGIF